MTKNRLINRNIILLAAAILLVVAAIIASGPSPKASAPNYTRVLDRVEP